jgi:enterochelin esterase family protein
VSRRIDEFRAAAAEDPAAATEALRADLAAARGPLVEPIEGDDDQVLVTFVWIGEGGTVGLHTQVIKAANRYSTPLERVEGTDVWYASGPARRDVRTVYQYVVDDPLLGLAAGERPNIDDMMKDLEENAARSFADPFNPRRLFPMGGLYLTRELAPEHWTSLLELDRAAPVPWYDAPPQSGTMIDHAFHSDVFGNDRTVTIYTPPGYERGGGPYPLVLAFDGEYSLRIGQTNLALDNLIAAGRIPPVVAAFVWNASPTSRFVELPCNDDMPRMLADELLPLLHDGYDVTTDPARVVVSGASYGGLVSSWVAFCRPDLFGNVLSMSGSYWWGQANPGAKYSYGRDGEPEWLTRQYAAAERKPIRFWVDIGLLEFGSNPNSPGIEHVGSNRHFRNVLQAKGYDVTYLESPGGHDLGIWQDTFARGLQVLLDGGGPGAEVPALPAPERKL